MSKESFQVLLTAPTKLEGRVFEEHGLDKAHVLITGIGTPLTLSSLLDYLYWHPVDLAIQVGFAGSFNESLTIGTTHVVLMDAFADVAWYSDGQREPVYKNHGGSFFPLAGYLLPNGLSAHVEGVRGITVHEPTMDKENIIWLKKYWSPDLETMEGAAFYLACNLRNVPSLQIRVVSNYVGDNREKWEFSLALQALKKTWVPLVKKIYPYV